MGASKSRGGVSKGGMLYDPVSPDGTGEGCLPGGKNEMIAVSQIQDVQSNTRKPKREPSHHQATAPAPSFTDNPCHICFSTRQWHIPSLRPLSYILLLPILYM